MILILEITYITHGIYREPHIYKVVNAFESNTYRDAPDWFHAEEKIHDKMEKVLNIIHCGIDETKVIRVKESDCTKLEFAQSAIESNEEKTNLSEENERLHGLLSLQAEGMKQMSQQIASYRELIFKEGKHNVNS